MITHNSLLWVVNQATVLFKKLSIVTISGGKTLAVIHAMFVAAVIPICSQSA